MTLRGSSELHRTTVAAASCGARNCYSEASRQTREQPFLSTIQMSDKWSIFRLEKSKRLLFFYGFYLDANDMETIAYLAFEFRVEFKPTPTLAFNVKSESKELWGKTQEFLLDFELMLV